MTNSRPNDEDVLNLLADARNALRCSYSPYSKFPVGAALRTKSGRIFTGTNVENASYGLTICAERVAIFKAVSEGEKTISAIAVVSSDGKPCPPCGACRQVISEFSDPTTVVVTDAENGIALIKIGELLPSAFGGSELERFKSIS